MEGTRQYSLDDLNPLPYRTLQQIAKSMALPSNVKKIYLIELIHAKTTKSLKEVENIIARVRFERQQLSHVNKRKSKKKVQMQPQDMEVSSTMVMSPPINATPKRSLKNADPDGLYVRCHIKPDSPLNKSDRILRSYNVKTYKRPNYSLINNPTFDLVRASEKCDNSKEAQISITSHGERVNLTARSVSMKKIRLNKPSISASTSCIKNNVDTTSSTYCQTMPTSRAIGSQVKFSSSSTSRVKGTSSFQPPKHNISTIYQVPATRSPLKNKTYNVEYVQSVGFRRGDGSISKINALVQKPAKTYHYLENVQTETFTDNVEIEVTVQDIINGNIAQTFTNPSTMEYTVTNSNHLANNCDYSDMVALSDVIPARREQTPKKQHTVKSVKDSAVRVYSVYYRKKTQAEQVQEEIKSEKPAPRSVYVPCHMPLYNTANVQQSLATLTDVVSKMKDLTQSFYVQAKKDSETSCTTSQMRSMPAQQNLPKITNAFSNIKDLSQPLYVQVGDEGQTVQPCALEVPGKPALEKLYNYKPEFLKNQSPSLQIAPTDTNTKCVFSTNTTCSAKEQNTCAQEAYPMYNPLDQDSQCANYDAVSQSLMEEYTEQEMTLRKYHEASLLNTSDSSLGTMDSQELETTLPEMVDDAMEIISQDGDYMERIEMDARMQCILCSWAGSKIVLYNHIKQEHHSQISIQERNDWVMTYRLGTLVNQPVWLSHVTECRGMFILSVKYEDPDCFMASLTTLSSHPVPKTGSITLYHKVTGEPYAWEGPIPQLPSNMPYDNGPDILKVELSKLELIPNSANLKLLNRSLVLNSPSKVIVGQPALNDIFINVFVNILD